MHGCLVIVFLRGTGLSFEFTEIKVGDGVIGQELEDMPLKLVSDWREMYERTIGVLTQNEPVFYGRIGGSDTDMAIDYLEGMLAHDDQRQLLERIRPHFKRVEEYNGYYDKHNDEANYLRFCEVLLGSYKSLRHASLGGGKWLTRYFKENINPRFWMTIGDKGPAYDHFMELIASKDEQCFMYPFPFIEKMISHEWSLFNAFREILRDRKVLVVSPFSATIEANFSRRGQFFKNYDYPAFELMTLNCPITYKGLPDELYPHENWFSTVDAIKGQLATLDFDIALMSCGSYAMPWGDFICNRLRKKAVYVGGVLQLFFGIIGRRYMDPYFLNQINQEYFVHAEERDIYLKHINIESGTAKEGFGAYL